MSNYFLHHWTGISFLVIVITLIIIIGLTLLISFFPRFKKPNIYFWLVILPLFLLFDYYGIDYITDTLKAGKIDKYFLVESEQGLRLAIITRIDKNWDSNLYKIHSFDLLTGKKIGSDDIAYDYFQIEIRERDDPLLSIYSWEEDEEIILDLSRGRVLEDGEEIAEAFPENSDLIKECSGISLDRVRNNKFDYRSTRSASSGKIFWNLNDARGTVGKKLQGFSINKPFPSSIKYLTREMPLAPDAITLLSPEYINDFFCSKCVTHNGNIDAAWIKHYASRLLSSDIMLSYIKADGTKIHTINFKEYLGYKNVDVFSTLLLNDDEILIFFSRGDYSNYHRSFTGYTLSAFKTNILTGKIIEQIDYIL